jgi:hypothetical protein
MNNPTNFISDPSLHQFQIFLQTDNVASETTSQISSQELNDSPDSFGHPEPNIVPPIPGEAVIAPPQDPPAGLGGFLQQNFNDENMNEFAVDVQQPILLQQGNFWQQASAITWLIMKLSLAVYLFSRGGTGGFLQMAFLCSVALFVFFSQVFGHVNVFPRFQVPPQAQENVAHNVEINRNLNHDSANVHQVNQPIRPSIWRKFYIFFVTFLASLVPE